jgi:UDP-N-acetylmuramoyl-tripeptide--D-alanyl-D-alanine ligase
MQKLYGDRQVIAVPDTLKALGDLARWWRRRHRARIVAVTGSSGKTTTKEMVAAVLELGGRTLKNRGNYNNLVGLPLTLLELETGVVHAALEMGMNHPGEIGRLTEIADPDVGVITNVGKAHLEGVGGLEGVALAKTELVEVISEKSAVVLNGDDALLMRAASRFGKPLVTFGFGPANQIRAEGVQSLGKAGMAFRLLRRGRAWDIRLGVPGVHNALNALAAAGAAFCLHMPAERIVEGLGRFKGMKGRFMVTELPSGVTLVDDTYNANPSSLRAALDSASALVREDARLIVGLGDMRELGAFAQAAHREAGASVASLGADLLLAMGEHAKDVVRGATEAGMHRASAEVSESHREMAKRIRDTARPGDVVLLKGSRKMEMEKVAEELRDRGAGSSDR